MRQDRIHADGICLARLNHKRRAITDNEESTGTMPEPLAPDSYGQFLADLKGRIRAAQLRASMAVNRELVLLYWQIGRDILERQQRENWGAKVIDRLAADLKRAFPDMKGFSPRNLKYSTLTSHRIARLILCFHNQMLVVLHGFIKKTQKTPADDLALAKRRMKEVTK